jgi:hypothetical protein
MKRKKIKKPKILRRKRLYTSDLYYQWANTKKAQRWAGFFV